MEELMKLKCAGCGKKTDNLKIRTVRGSDLLFCLGCIEEREEHYHQQETIDKANQGGK
jgi:hypothetical protein